MQMYSNLLFGSVLFIVFLGLVVYDIRLSNKAIEARKANDLWSLLALLRKGCAVNAARAVVWLSLSVFSFGDNIFMQLTAGVCLGFVVIAITDIVKGAKEVTKLKLELGKTSW